MYQSLEIEHSVKDVNSRKRHPFTCDWLFKRDEYLQWEDAGGPVCLWVSGCAGSGKTLLLSALLNNLLFRQEDGEEVIVHCFFEQGLEGDDFARHSLKVLLGQLVEKHAVPKSALYSILSTIEAIDSYVSRNFFQQIFRDLLNYVASHCRVILILDTSTKDMWINTVVLDEIIRANNSRKLSKLVSCAMSSREYSDQSFNREHVRNISLDHEIRVQDDVLRYSESRLAQTFHNDVSLPLASLAKQLCLKGIGNFLWVALVIESTSCGGAHAKIGTSVDSLPSTIDGLYQRALDNVTEQNKGKVHQLLSWLLVARRSLQLNELSEALRVETRSSMSLETVDLPIELEEVLFAEVEILQWCSPLINLSRKNTVEFVHHSVKEYLLCVNEANTWRMSIHKAHQMLAETCLTLLTLGEDADPVHRSSSQRPYLFPSLWAYASMYWTLHYVSGELHSTTLFSVLHNFLLDNSYHDCRRFSLPELQRPNKVASTTLRIAACHGITSLVRVSLEMGVSPNGDDCGECASPLALAVAGGHSNAVKILLQQGASVTSCNPKRIESLLHQAAFPGDCGSAILLMENSAQTDLAPGSLRSTPLQAASSLGHLNIVKLLLEQGADVNGLIIPGCLRSTPLHAACSLGHLDTVKLLLEQGADVNASIAMTRETPLHLAASGGHFEIVKWLLEAIEPSPKEMEFYNSMVQQYYHQSWMDTVVAEPVSDREVSWENKNSYYAQEKIHELQSGQRRYVDIESRTREGRTALHLAAFHGHNTITELLLSHAADINAIDNKGHTALQIAAVSGRLDVVRLLLGISANSRRECNSPGPILKLAVANGHDTVAELLAWHCFTREVVGQSCQEPLLSLPLRSKMTTVRDAIRRGTFRKYDQLRPKRTQKRTQQ